MNEQEEFEFRLRFEREQGAPAAEPVQDKRASRPDVDALGGIVRGAGSIGATILSPLDWAARALNKGQPVNVGGFDIAGHDRRAGMDGALDSVGVDRNSLAFGAGKLGTEIAGTLGVGGGLANLAGRAIPAIAHAPALTALRTSGMTTGLNPVTFGQKAADMSVRMAAGGTSGAAAAGLLGPEDAMAGGAIGMAAPGAFKAAGAAGKFAGNALSGSVKHALGMSTGVGAESIAQAYKAGKTGNKAFVDNMRGNVPLTDVLDQAKQGLEVMRAAKSAQYRSGMVPIANDSTVLRFTGIDKALDDAAAVSAFKGQVKNETAAGAVGKMREVVDEWRQLDPQQFHTPEGMDALKQKLGGIMEGIKFEERTARLAAGKVYSATKASIEDQAPAYAGVMRDYTQASQQISEIERALSLKPGASQDTALRKLQSLMRNNVQTNYGGRLKNAAALEDVGGVEIMPAIAGQALSSWTPRSLAAVGSSATALGSLLHPGLAAALPFQSPRMVGSMAYGAGRGAGLLAQGADAMLPRSMAQMGHQRGANLAPPDALTQLGYRLAPLAEYGR